MRYRQRKKNEKTARMLRQIGDALRKIAREDMNAIALAFDRMARSAVILWAQIRPGESHAEHAARVLGRFGSRGYAILRELAERN
jgi:hypothetical protein